MPLRSADVDRMLRTKLAAAVTQGDHQNYILEVDGKKVGKTFMSHGQRGAVGDDLVRMMSRQCHVTMQESRNLVACPMSGDDWRELIRAKELD